MKEFYQLRAMEKTIEDIEYRIESNAIFCDPSGELLPTLGLSWRQDVLRFLQGQTSPGYMPLENIERFLATVRAARQRLKGNDRSDEESIKFFRGRWRELIQFLQRAVQVLEPLYCDL